MAGGIDLRSLGRIYETEMSEGDRSCFLAMLKAGTATQMTVAGSGHCRFYELLAREGWATADAAAPAAPMLRVWQLTEAGRKSLPTMLFGTSVDYERRQLEAWRTWHRLQISALLIGLVLVLYSAVFLGVGSVVPGQGQAVLNAMAGVILVGVLVGALWAAIRGWAELPARGNPMARLGRLEFLAANRVAIAAAMAAAVVLIGLGRSGLRLGLADEAPDLSRMMLQVMVQGALGFAVGWFLGPGLVAGRKRSMFDRKR